MDFWPGFCSSSGVFCIGEVFGGADIGLVDNPYFSPSFTVGVRPIAMYQGPQALDSVLNYPMYSALISAFAMPGPQNMSAVVNYLQRSQKSFKVCVRNIG